ncbi:MAG: valyl-tRNA synthetase [Actinomycetia bacterium]|jgi:valyl-tRNA synthetase|nr:valyl-tRNA synthetase [Actinomycetes bacterium]
MEMEPLYKPHGVEERWQRAWEGEGLYHADPEAPGETYVIAIPPPNVTGALHMGHALNGTIQDVLIRWHRMRGFNTLWQPGYDHAGIATQAAVERELRKEGTSRLELGRDAFVERVWEWLHEYGGIIMSQFRRLGCSLDYERERFTMDDGYVRAVMRFFVHLYERGWMFRDNRIVNWCTDCGTTVSDLEVEHIDVDDTLTYARYALADGDGFVTIATARPATILADVALAVHPDDERYKALIGKDVIVPVVGRKVPVIADERVDPTFGTGALKITPGHDPTDFEIGRDHGLPELTVIGFDGRITGDVPDDFRGLTEAEAAERVVAWLKEHDQLEKREHYRHAVGHCDRSGTRIQPLVMLQWWCAMDDLARPAIEAIDSGRVRFHPPVHGRVASDWLKAIRPWNVSRQLWWGHQLPIWYCPDGHVTCAETEPTACAVCGSPELTRDPDVLDTWFSSALWPFATLGWPDDTPELRRYYPGDVNSTGRDIIFLWVNRMVMAGIELMGDIPFRDVIIHSTILASDGQRMSKSKGTGLDPVELIEQHGADATRYGLLKMSSTQDVRFTPVPIEEGRRLANKLWNASRLLLMSGGDEVEARPKSLEERWILARIDATRSEIERDFETYDFSHAVDRLYHLTFDDFCDWYLESIKPRLGEADVKATAFAALERLLELLHPVLAHVTEEIWSHLPAREGRLIVAPWLQPDASYAADVDALVRVQEAAERFRRSGVVTPLDGDEKRIFDAVVKPERAKGNGAGRLEEEVARLEGEIARSEKMLSNERFVANARAEVVQAEREKLERYRRELDAIRN